MSEVAILPEMLEAGVEALTESRIRKLDDVNTAVAVFLAMRGLEEIFLMRGENRSVH